MGEKIIEYVWKNKNERNEALSRITNLSEIIVEMAEEGDYICEPLDERGYQACVYSFFRLLPPMSIEDSSKYKKLILDERWELKYKRSDELIELGVGKREQLSIGLSADAIDCIFDDYFMQEYNENEDFISNDLDAYSNEPILIVEHSPRVEYIEKILDDRNVTLESALVWNEQNVLVSDASEVNICLSELLGRNDITDTTSLIEDTRKQRNCSVCEAIVESGFVVLEAWCKMEQQ